MKFPFAGHRTMAEVAETEALLLERDKGWKAGWKGTRHARRLDELLDLADINNGVENGTRSKG